MGLSEIETTDYTLVMLGLDLLNSQDDCAEFQEKINAEVSWIVDQDIPFRELRIPKDRTKIFTRTMDRTVESSGVPRTDILMEYPASKEDLERFAEIAGLSISCSKNPGQLLALGHNATLVYNQDSGVSSHEYLARLFNPSIHPQWNLHGGSCKLEFREPGKKGIRWNLVLEPRHNKLTTTKIYANLNLHLDTSELPTADEVKSNMERAWNETRELIHLL